MKSRILDTSSIAPFIFYSTGKSSHTHIFLDSFRRYPKLRFSYISSGKNTHSLPAIIDTTYSRSIPVYMTLHPFLTVKYLRYGFKKLIRIIGLHRRVETLRKIKESENIKFIYSQQLTGPGIVSYLSNIPYIVSIWGSDINKIRFLPELQLLSRKTLLNASLIHALSHRQKELLVREGISPQKIFIQHFGVTTDLLRPRKSKQSLKSMYGLKGQFIIFSPRGHSPLYRPELIVKIIKEVHKSFKNLKVIVTGEWPETDHYKRLVRKTGLNDVFVFVGHVDRKRYIDFNQMSDIYLQTPMIDGVSVAVMESLASGTPVISSNVGDSQTNIKHGYNGYLIEGDNAENYSSFITNLFEDKETLIKLQKQAIHWARRHCDRDEAIENILKHLMIFSSRF